MKANRYSNMIDGVESMNNLRNTGNYSALNTFVNEGS